MGATESGLVLPDGAGRVVPSAFDASRGGSRSEREKRALMNALVALNEKAQEKIAETLRIANGMGEELEAVVKRVGMRDVLIAVLVNQLPAKKVSILASQLDHFARCLEDGTMELRMEMDPSDGTHRLTFLRHELHLVPNTTEEVDDAVREARAAATSQP